MMLIKSFFILILLCFSTQANTIYELIKIPNLEIYNLKNENELAVNTRVIDEKVLFCGKVKDEKNNQTIESVDKQPGGIEPSQDKEPHQRNERNWPLPRVTLRPPSGPDLYRTGRGETL